MASGLVSRVKDALARVGVKAPWKITGPLASSEWLSQDSEANQYRSKAPMNQGKASVPWADTDKIYDIKYFSRDTRHIGAVGGLNLSRTRVIVHQKDAKGKDIPGGVDLDGPVPVAFGNVSTSLTMHSDLAPSGYTGEGQTASK